MFVHFRFSAALAACYSNIASRNARTPSMQHEADPSVRSVFSGIQFLSFNPTVMAKAPLVIMASVPPSHVAKGNLRLDGQRGSRNLSGVAPFGEEKRSESNGGRS
jgi:hypothetical protein